MRLFVFLLVSAFSVAIEVRAKSVPQDRASTPTDEALMAELEAEVAFESLLNIKPRIGALIREVAAFRDSHGLSMDPTPGGARRREAHDDLLSLRDELHRRRALFEPLGAKKGLSSMVLTAMKMRVGETAAANRTLQSIARHEQIVQDCKELGRSIDVLLDEEERAYQAAAARWRDFDAARVRRRMAAEAAAAVVASTLGFLAWRRLRPARPTELEGAASGRGRLGRWVLGGFPKAWAYGRRWDGSRDDAGISASVRLFDESMCAPPSSPEKLLGALKAVGPAELPGAPLEAFAVETSVVLAYPHSGAKPLAKWLEEGQAVPPDQVATLLRRLAPLLDSAHRAGRVHGGLTPECVLIGGDGAVFLEDFGVAVALAAVGGKTFVLPAYSAPELATERPAPAADLYSVGVILYELLTGRHPFEGTNLPAMKKERRYAPLSRAVPGCPTALVALLDGLLEPDPARRRPTAGSLADALKALG